MRTLQVTLEEAIEICKALANEHRMQMLNVLNQGPLNVNEISELLQIPFSTAAVNVKKLEDAGIISTEIVPGRGTQKVNSKRYDRIVINLKPAEVQTENNLILDMPIGEYTDCEAEPTCGLVGEHGILSIIDDPRSFYEPERKNAQLLWFRAGFVEYRFPNRVPYGTRTEELEFSAEICSEAPYHKLDWPSDITLWINGVEVGTWTSPGDLGGMRGFLTPDWWATRNTQYGLLKHWQVNGKGSLIDGNPISDVTIDQLKIATKPFISVRLGVKKDAANAGGMNLFGKRFGNYEQALILKIKYANTSASAHKRNE
ncbi:ArsR/SmtB family transcription factor [Paenibacillus piri]|uniref:ArsR family transcriptional regulator n=1 Tax=Paenibacillus piri TaxID=2547395 RepID=A0A4R5KIC6_9BACL|nr:ArsR family transcriptional regulator [Paenibacillus piri]TDF94167.1 ArsR family transcriptional regulator [Paenibacillus piri]